MTGIAGQRISGRRIAGTRIAGRRIGAGDAASPLIFSASLQNSLTPSKATGSPTPTFTRASSATFVDYAGVVKTVAAGVPRFMGSRLDGDGETFHLTKADGTTPIGSGDYYADASGPFGYVSEGARTNLITYSRDFSNAAWTKTNVTAAKDTTGRDGVASSASTLTSTAANGTCRQTVTSASATRTISCDIKRKTGTGTIEMTVDGGSTYTDITSQINGSTWTRVQVSQAAVTNPNVGFRIVTSGDAIYVDYFGLESATFASSRIATTSAAVTRNADALTYDDAGNIEDAAGTSFAEIHSFWEISDNQAYALGGGASARHIFRAAGQAASVIQAYDGTNYINSAVDLSKPYYTGIAKAALTWGDAFRQYLDGAGGTAAGYDGSIATGNLSVGHNYFVGSTQWHGTIRNVRIYNVELTEAEVAAL